MEAGNCTALTSATASGNSDPSTITSPITDTTQSATASKRDMMRGDESKEDVIGQEQANSISTASKTNTASLNNKSGVEDNSQGDSAVDSETLSNKSSQPGNNEPSLQTDSKPGTKSDIKLDKSKDLSSKSVDDKAQNSPQTSSSISTNNNKTALETIRDSPSPRLAGSSSKPPQGRRYSSTTASPERPPLVGIRKLSIQPRTTQYEPHPLLQGHNEQGRSLLEELFAERLMYNPDLKLQPRGAECERSALMQRNESGLTELEVYLQERERELNRNPMMKACSVDSTSSSSARRAMLLRQQSMPETRPRLEPRVLQFEQTALLAEKDQTGMTLLDAFLAEKEQDIEQGSDNGSITSKGKCSEKCTCKNANCPVCKGPGSKSAYSTPSSSGSHPPLMKKESSRETVIEPKANNKRVHFSESGEEEDEDNNHQNGDQDSTKSPAKQKTNNQNSDNNTLTSPDSKNRTSVESKCKAKAKRKCVVS